MIRTLATEAQAALLRAQISGKWIRPTLAQKRAKTTVAMVPSVTRCGGGREALWYELDLPVLTAASNENGNRWNKSARAGHQVNIVIAGLQAHLRAIDRAAISGITLTRISPGKLDAHDNLPQAFKHVLDATCAWIVRGDDFCDADRKRIGRFDDELLNTGKGHVTCNYEQTSHEVDRRLQGIRIRLQLTS